MRAPLPSEGKRQVTTNGAPHAAAACGKAADPARRDGTAMQTSTIDQAASALKRGRAVIFPTDTVYGLGVAVDAASGPDILYDLKERDAGKPIAWLVGGLDDLDRYGRVVPELARTLARTFWPGPLTLVVKASDEVPSAFRSAEGTIGLRMPNNATALALVRAVGCPLATSSANVSGVRAPRSLDAVDPAFAERVGLVVADDADGDKSGVASTVLDCTQDHPVVVREGAVTIADIRALS